MDTNETDTEQDIMDPYAVEAKALWGHTDQYAQSQVRVAKMGKDGLRKVGEEQKSLTEEIAVAMRAGKRVDSQETQTLIARHYDGLRHFYEPTIELYAGLADMYVADARFAKYYEDIAPGLAQYMSDAMKEYCAHVSS